MKLAGEDVECQGILQLSLDRQPERPGAEVGVKAFWSYPIHFYNNGLK